MGTFHDTRSCPRCGTLVPRKFCHRNRRGEYICQACHAKQRKAGMARRFLTRAQLTLYKTGRTTLYVSLAILVALAVSAIIVEIAA